jgi:hypothetical protein
MKKDKILRNPYVRIFIVVFTSVLTVFAVVFLSIIAYRTLFQNNPHFVLRHIVVKSSGYWNARDEEVKKILGIKKGENNLFNINVVKLKDELLRKKKYSIENVDIDEKLPDTLIFNITERIPRALLYNRKSELLVDNEAVLINKSYCIDIDSTLPIITGFKINGINASQSLGKSEIPYGRILFQLKPALELIELVNTSYPEFSVKVINLYNDNELAVFMVGPLNRSIIRVLFPFTYSKDEPMSPFQYKRGIRCLKTKLAELKELYDYLRMRGKGCSEIIMLFNGQAIVK